jgi:hypothetical protein
MLVLAVFAAAYCVSAMTGCRSSRLAKPQAMGDVAKSHRVFASNGANVGMDCESLWRHGSNVNPDNVVFAAGASVKSDGSKAYAILPEPTTTVARNTVSVVGDFTLDAWLENVTCLLERGSRVIVYSDDGRFADAGAAVFRPLDPAVRLALVELSKRFSKLTIR